MSIDIVVMSSFVYHVCIKLGTYLKDTGILNEPMRKIIDLSLGKSYSKMNEQSTWLS